MAHALCTFNNLLLVGHISPFRTGSHQKASYNLRRWLHRCIIRRWESGNRDPQELHLLGTALSNE
jgi:hypothetical protein